MSWPLVTIKSVATVTTGKTPSTKVEEYFGGSIPFITPAELGVTATVLSPKQSLTEAGAAKIKLVPKNSVLVCCIGSLGKLAIADRELGTNQQINSVTFDESKVYPKYGYYALSLLKPTLESMAPATTVAIVNKSKFESLKIPLPPLEEQKRIASILDKADAIRQKRQKAIELANEFLHSVFLDMFGDPVTNPKGWEVVSLASRGAFKNGLNFGKGESGISIRCLGVGDFKSLTTIDNMESLSSIDLDVEPTNEYLLKDGDLLFVRSNGNKSLVGRCVSVYPKQEKVTFSGFCIRYRAESNELESYYLNYLFHTPSIKKEMLKGGQGANIQNINQKTLSAIKIPVPPKDLQVKFSNIVTMFKQSEINNMQHPSELDKLISALSSKAFSGQL